MDYEAGTCSSTSRMEMGLISFVLLWLFNAFWSSFQNRSRIQVLQSSYGEHSKPNQKIFYRQIQMPAEYRKECCCCQTMNTPHSAFRMSQGQRVAPARRRKLGDDGNQIWAHSALRTLHSALERLFSCIHFGMDDCGNWRLNFIRRQENHLYGHCF